MDIGIVSMRYAKALMEYARSTGTEELFYGEMGQLAQAFRTCPDLRAALDNPIVTQREKVQLICVAAVGNGSPRQELMRFITLLLHNRREGFLQYIALAFLDLYRKDRHIGVGHLTTAVPVTPEVSERIRQSAAALLHARMELQTEVNPAIGGGFVFDINDFRLDASIATQLKHVKQQFIEKNRRIV